MGMGTSLNVTAEIATVACRYCVVPTTKWHAIDPSLCMLLCSVDDDHHHDSNNEWENLD